MSLLTYQEARPWAKAIKEEVLERRMPPWGAVKGFGDFQNDVSLSQEEIHLLADWVEGGAPEGDSVYAPYPPDLDELKPPAAPPGITVQGSLVLPRRTTVFAIRPETIREGATVRVIAQRPDGGIEPLLWLYQFKPQWRRTYIYRTPVSLPRGSKVELLPPDAGTIVLVDSEQPRETSAAPSHRR